MKLPSIQYLVQNSKDSVKRFPLSLITAFAAVCLGIYMVEFNKEIKDYFPYVNLMLCAGLGIPLFFCAAVVGNRRHFSNRNQLLLNLACVVVLGLIFLSLPGEDTPVVTAQPYIKYAIYNLIIHLLVAVAPFIGPGEVNGFWNYNKSLFLRFITSMLYSGFLFAGLALALVSLNLLFDMKIHDELYAEMWIFIAGFVNTWFFLSGVPKDFDELESVTKYPKGLKIFAQYILLPLLALYLIILYVYGGKILFSWDWPKGIVSYLIVCVAVLGILNLLLLYPYGKNEEDSWIGKVSKAYYFVLVPLTVILFIAITMRLGDYGITVKRYVIFLLGLWLLVVCAYFIFGKKNIKFIPASLAVMLALMSFGPWGMFSVSAGSQEARLEKLLSEAGILKDGKVQNGMTFTDSTFNNSLNPKTKNDKLLSDSLHNEVRSIVKYLGDFHGYSDIEEWFGQDLEEWAMRYRSLDKNRYRWLTAWELHMYALGLDPSEITEMDGVNTSYNYSARQDKLISLKGYEHQLWFNLQSKEMLGRGLKDSLDFKLNDKNYVLSLETEKPHRLLLVHKGDTTAVPLRDMAFKLSGQHNGDHYESNIDQQDMQLKLATPKGELDLKLKNFSFDRIKDSLSINSIDGYLLIKGF